MRSDLRYLFASVAATAAFTFLALAFPNMSRVATIPAAIACAVLTVYFLWPEIRDFHKNRQKRVIALIGMIVCSIGFAGFAAFYFWPSGISANDLPKVETVVAQPSAPLLFEWKWSKLPTAMPTSGTVWTMSINSKLDFGGQPVLLGMRPGTPGDKLGWGEDNRQYGGVYRCDITNYAGIPIFNLVMTFKTEFFKPDEDGGLHPKEPTEAYDRPVVINKLDPKETFSFYAYSDSRMYARVWLPNEVTYLRDEKRQRETARLMPQAEQTITLFPMTLVDQATKSHPEQSPQVPSPPTTQEKQ